VVTYNPPAGDGLAVSAAKAAQMALSGETVILNHNGVRVTVYPGMTAEQVETAYATAHRAVCDAAMLRRMADVIERYSLRVASFQRTLEGTLVLQVLALPAERELVESHIAYGHRHTAATLDGVPLIECHPLTAADFGGGS
jgi:hypothetical protein